MSETEPPPWGVPPAAPRVEPAAPLPPFGAAGYAAQVGRPGQFEQPRQFEQPESAVRARATIALVVNVVVALCCFGLMSIPGAIAAGMAIRAIPTDPKRAARLVRWSWAFLALNVLFYILLACAIVAVVVAVLLARKHGS